MRKLIAIIGARPQFIKHAPIELAFKNKAEIISIHTGQHYDQNMSDIFFQELDIPKPLYELGIQAATHGAMTGRMLEEIEKVLLKEKGNYFRAVLSTQFSPESFV